MLQHTIFTSVITTVILKVLFNLGKEMFLSVSVRVISAVCFQWDSLWENAALSLGLHTLSS